jgi:hypothetical protein
VTDVWIGDPNDPPLATEDDFQIASGLVALTGVWAALLTSVIVAFIYES